MEKVAALVLASQRHRAFDTPKQLLDWDGVPLLQAVVDQVCAWPVASVIVVIGADEAAILDAVDLGPSLVVVDPEWREGEAAAVRSGLDTITREGGIEDVFIVDGDQPDVDETTVLALLEADAGDAVAIVPVYRYARGRPILVRSGMWSRLMGLERDSTVEHVVQTHPELVHEVQVDRVPARRIASHDDYIELRPHH